jgi:endonuclease YncB( thermonuclease family)
LIGPHPPVSCGALRFFLRRFAATLCTLLLVAGNTAADTLVGRVTYVDDGDSLEMRDGWGTLFRVRLRGIDAPERGQAYADVSRRNLGRLIRGREVTISFDQTDKYGRLLAWLYIDDGVSVNLMQVQAGLAWHYAFPGRPWTVDDDLLSRAQQDARAANAGLWARPGPVPPWIYRREHRDEPWRSGK